MAMPSLICCGRACTTALLIAAALGLTFAMRVLLPHAVFPFLVFYPAVFLAAWLRGTASGIVTIFVGIGVGWFFYLHFLIVTTIFDTNVLLPTFVFVVTGVLMTWMSGKYRRSLSIHLEALKSRDDFLSIASHELKTPLSSLKMQIQLGRRSFTDEKLPSIFTVCEKQVDRLILLVNDLLDVSQIQSGRLKYNFQNANISKLVAEVCEQYSAVAIAGSCPITTEIKEGLQCRCDGFRIEQVLVNLLSNAIKYGNGHPILVALWNEAGHIILEVRDSGIGIELAKQAAIFDRYERALSAKNYSGLGLGLYITRFIVDGHGGTIGLNSSPAKGSVFTVRLPLTDERFP
jgi:signal transduction histidine kinase